MKLLSGEVYHLLSSMFNLILKFMFDLKENTFRRSVLVEFCRILWISE